MTSNATDRLPAVTSAMQGLSIADIRDATNGQRAEFLTVARAIVAEVEREQRYVDAMHPQAEKNAETTR